MKLSLLHLQILLHYYTIHEQFMYPAVDGVVNAADKAEEELIKLGLIEYKNNINQWWLTQKGADHVMLLLQIPVCMNITKP